MTCSGLASVGSGTAAPVERRVTAPALSATAVACPTGYTEKRLIGCWKSMMAPLATVYAPLVRSRGKAWHAPELVVFYLRPPRNPCHSAVDGDVMGSFYCPANRTIYLDTYQAEQATGAYLANAAKVPGVLADDARRAGVTLARLKGGYATRGQATILAHEYAHHASSLIGLEDWYSAKAEAYQVGSSRYDRWGFTAEMASDCLSGYALARGKVRRLIPGTAFDIWASRAFLAQTNPFDQERPVRSPFVYRNRYAGAIPRGYGGAYWRLRSFDTGWRTGLSGGDGLTRCYTAAAGWKQVAIPSGLLKKVS
ncbi:MAG: neutral zinc metallopeptidase [Candidatus Nanopelagicales bacterium]